MIIVKVAYGRDYHVLCGNKSIVLNKVLFNIIQTFVVYFFFLTGQVIKLISIVLAGSIIILGNAEFYLLWSNK